MWFLNLYEERGTAADPYLVCKGCDERIDRRDQERHHKAHKRHEERARKREADQARKRALALARAAKKKAKKEA
jgi:hypothetical protein